jgi:hypothetical protein
MVNRGAEIAGYRDGTRDYREGTRESPERIRSLLVQIHEGIKPLA